ncbi:MFS transporter [Verrucomicrobiaceae bacterium N1E253]|uniref:MFS transporter n=1 Tax=Oceaniferula marina TaxID=2748318 RepID=A0A851GCP9_9BACT|nr:MFS transporter [Oceaniferula marina]NWK55518.1 MFS transporter [Oceaniferula marina]
MKQLVDLIRHTRRFRYTLTLLLIFGALFAVSQTRSQESGAPDPAAEEVEVPEKGMEKGVEKEIPVEPELAAEPDSAEKKQTEGREIELEKVAETFLGGLSSHLSSKPVPEDTVLPDSIIGMTCNAELDKEGDDDQKGLRHQLGDKEKAGQYIHDLRMRGVVPVQSIRWIRPQADKPMKSDKDAKKKPEPSAVLWGIITVDDKRNPNVKNWEPRSRAVKISFQERDGKRLISDIERPKVRELGGVSFVEHFIQQLKSGKQQEAWNSGSKLMQAERDAEAFHADMVKGGFLKDGKIEWGEETAIEGGYKLNGVLNVEGGASLPFYVALLETADGLKVLDFQSTDSFFSRVIGGRGDTLDMVLAVFVLALLLGFLYIIVSYVKGLWGSPRELYILFFTKLTEYSAYGAAQLTFMFYLREDLGLGDLGAGTYYSTWSTVVTAVTMVVGAICDTIGVKKTLLIGSVLLLISRVVMPFSDNLWVVTLLGFIPLGIGVAITGPVLSVGIKRFTTIEGAALGFGLFYTLMNVGWAVGAKIFDVVRIRMGEMGSVDFLGDTLSTWQVLFGIGFFINLPDLLAILWMRDGVEMTEHGVKFPDKKERGYEADGAEGSMWQRSVSSLRSGVVGSVKLFGDNFVQRAFWVFILLIGITVFARLTFFHFHITWPSYGIRYFGQGSLVGNVFGVLNPLLIVFLVPVVAYLTRKVRSYWLLLVGTIVSVASVVFVVLPPEVFAGLADTWFGIVVYERWLEVPVGNRDPYYLSMVLFVIVFTIGEAIWSPRLMQFTAEIAPPGREGSYISLSYLPYFGAKFIVGPMAGMLLTEYSPEFGVDGIYGYYPDHQMIWWWVGGTAALTPIGLLAFKKLYRLAEARAEEAAQNE